MPEMGLEGQGWLQIGELGLVSLLSALIGLEREIRQKSARLRTYTLVGVASALIMLVSKYGFMNILLSDRICRCAPLPRSVRDIRLYCPRLGSRASASGWRTYV
jgi:hypothetical protein